MRGRSRFGCFVGDTCITRRMKSALTVVRLVAVALVLAAPLQVLAQGSSADPMWEIVKDSTDRSLLEAYVTAYPQSPHVAAARARLAPMSNNPGAAAPPPATSPPRTGSPPPQLAGSAPLAANEAARIVGTWKLVSFVWEFQDGRPSYPVVGPNPNGFLILTPEGRRFSYFQSDARVPPKSDEDRAKLYSAMSFTAGPYQVAGNRLRTTYEVASDPALTGGERVADFKLDGDRITFVSPWTPSTSLPGNPMFRGANVWERMK